MACKVYFEADDPVELVRLIMGIVSITQEATDDDHTAAEIEELLRRQNEQTKQIGRLEANAGLGADTLAHKANCSCSCCKDRRGERG